MYGTAVSCVRVTNHQYFLPVSHKDSTTPSPLINTRCMLGALLGSLLDVLRYPLQRAPPVFAPARTIRLARVGRARVVVLSNALFLPTSASLLPRSLYRRRRCDADTDETYPRWWALSLPHHTRTPRGNTGWHTTHPGRDKTSRLAWTRLINRWNNQSNVNSVAGVGGRGD